MRVVVGGGGIAGLSAATGLRRAGMRHQAHAGGRNPDRRQRRRARRGIDPNGLEAGVRDYREPDKRAAGFSEVVAGRWICQG